MVQFFTFFRFSRFLLLALGAMGIFPAAADQQEDSADYVLELDPIVVVASKRQQPLSGVAAQVTVIDALQVSETLVEDLDGLLRYEPGLEVESSGTRFGSSAINIRGIGGNRVAIEVDGIPTRDRVALGAFSDAGRALLETDRIKRVEVLHGPASVMYGSNALGGIVSVTSWDPDDLLAASDGKVAGSMRAGYQGLNDSWIGSGIAAQATGAHALLVAATWRDGHERDNQAPADVPDDPQAWDSQDYMLRYTFDTAKGNRLRLTAQATQRDVNTDMRSQLGFGRRFLTTTELLGFDHDESERFSADYEFASGGWEQGVLRVFHVGYETEQLTHETRGKAKPPVEIQRLFNYEQQHDGVSLNLFRSISAGRASHRVGLGLDWLQTRSEEFRDGLQTNLVTGVSSNVILGEKMPVRDFPNSRSRELGLYLQDEISFDGSRWELVPALRWDHYELEPQVDQLWLEDYPDVEVVDITDSRFTPRLAALYRFTGQWSLYGQYSAGFRAPPFEDVNIGLFIPLFGYRAIPNPDLQSETSHGFELGNRWISDHSRLSTALFYTEYDDFIESRALIGVEPQTGELIFQSRNIGQARIYGADIRYDQDMSAWHDALQGWVLKAAAYWSLGENRDSNQSLNSIAPPQAIMGTAWHAADDRWNLELTGTFTAAKNLSDIDQTTGTRFATGSWLTLDLVAGWQPADQLQLRAGIFNLADEKYWRWLDVANLQANDPMIAVLSQAGRTWSLSLSVGF